MMQDFLEQTTGTFMVPEPICQVGTYELDLLRFWYFGWLTGVSVGFNVLQQQCFRMVDQDWPD